MVLPFLLYFAKNNHVCSVTGAVLRIPQIESLGDYEYFEDGKYWEIEEEEEED